jgi:hypothetical protein
MVNKSFLVLSRPIFPLLFVSESVHHASVHGADQSLFLAFSVISEEGNKHFSSLRLRTARAGVCAGSEQVAGKRTAPLMC